MEGQRNEDPEPTDSNHFSNFMFFAFPITGALAAEPIKIGAPLSTAYLYGWDAERGIKLAIDEINAQGGVNVGGEKRPFAVDVIDTRDLEPGVPVSEALMAMDKLILEKKIHFIIGGPSAPKRPWQPCPFCPSIRWFPF